MGASTTFNAEETRRIESAVADAEKRTSAEIVPAVATCSGRYDRAEDIIGLWLGLIALAIVWLIANRPPEQTGDWGGPAGTLQLLWLGSAVVGGFLVGAFVAPYLPALRRVFVPRQEREECVRDAALRLFHDSRIHHTQTGSGILIYVSLFERQAAVIADEAVLDTLGQSAIDSLCGDLIERLRRGKPAEALCSVIESAGAQLETVLPRQSDDINELENTLVLIDG